MEEEIGRITHYFSKIGVAVIEITSGSLKIGETIHIKGHTSDFTQTVDSMQEEHEPIEEAKAGMSVGMKVKEAVREGDKIFKVTADA